MASRHLFVVDDYWISIFLKTRGIPVVSLEPTLYAYRFGEAWEETPARLGQFLPDRLPAAARASLRPHPPAPREALWTAMRGSRLMLYGGHPTEAICLAVAEAQALGVPAVVRSITVMPERVRDGVTGFVAGDEDAFVRGAVAVLRDDGLWRRQHEAALALQQGWSWDEMAAAFEARVLERDRRTGSRGVGGWPR